MSRSIDWVHLYMCEQTARIVAKSGIPSDRFHVGKIVLQSLRDDPEFLAQIDGGTGESETNGSVLKRSIQCATWFRDIGLQRGDVIILMAPNHLDLIIPYYAALYLGISIAPTDTTLGVVELQDTFTINRPKIVFCQSEKEKHIQEALDNIQVDAKVVRFDKGHGNFSDILEQYEVDVHSFEPTEFDPEETIAFLVATSGTTGLPKAAAISHKNASITGPYLWGTSTKFPSPTRSVLIVAPLQWMTTIFNFVISAYMKYCRVLTSSPITQDHIYEIINQYKPTFLILSPTMMTTLMTPGERDRCDFTCFQTIYLGGSSVQPELIEEIKKICPEIEVANMYGASELAGLGFEGLGAPSGACGTRIGCMLYKLVNSDTGEEINNPNVPGELWLKGPSIVKGYYKNPAATEEAFTDGWFKTGDMFYRDDSWNFYFVERIKLLLKYRSHHISPVEVEGVIRQHPGVLDVAVTGVPDNEFGDLAVACVVPKPDWKPNALEIKDLVKRSLADTKQLRGGVIFMKELPLTPSTKIHRQKLKQIVLTMERE